MTQPTIRSSMSFQKTFLLLILVIFLMLTNRWLDWPTGIQFLSANDALAYQKIAEAAPNFPSEPLLFHHAQRFVAPYLVGLVAQATSMSIPVVFRIAAFAGMTIVILLFERLLSWFPLSLGDYGLCLVLLLLNPYTFRYYAIVPGMLPDLVFLVGLSALLLGLVRSNTLLVLGGMAIATIGRQTAVTLLPGILLWLWQGKPSKQQPLSHKLPITSLVLIITLVVYHFTGTTIRSFALPDQNLEVVVGLFSWLGDRFSLRIFLDHSLRLIIPLLIPIVLLLSRSKKSKLRTPKSSSLETQNATPSLTFPLSPSPFSRPVWACLLMVAGILAQPFLAGPEITGQNATRLAALAILPLLTALVMHLAHQPWWVTLHPGLIPKLMLATVLVIGSFHHLYTVLTWSNTAMFAAAQLTIVGIVTYLALTQSNL